MKKYTLELLKQMPTIYSGQYDNLKLETKEIRIWLSRMTIEDGQPYNNQVTVEKFIKGFVKNDKSRYGSDIYTRNAWHTVEQYEAI